MTCPSYLLSASELSALAPGDLVQHADGSWYTVEKVYDLTATAGGVPLIPFFARMVDAPNVSWSDALVGPSQVASDPSQWNGTHRERVQFQPEPCADSAVSADSSDLLALMTLSAQVPDIELVALPAAAVLATLPLPVSLRASVLLASWDEAARLDRRTAAAGPENEMAWRWHAAAMEQCARELRGALEHAGV